MARAKGPDLADVAGGVARVMDDPRVVWFPVKHFSAACAHHVERAIEAVRPAAVLVEGPSDGDALLDTLTHPGTEPPLAIFSAYVDQKNTYGLNGTLSAAEDVPARYRAWWPLTRCSPEYVALVAGRRVGADVGFCDIPLNVRIPEGHARGRHTSEAVDDHHLATSQYFEALRARQRRRSFGEFWEANFEVGGFDLPTDVFVRRLLTFAWCARYARADRVDAPALAADGTLLREAHMRYHVDRALKAHPDGRVVVVTGAFHSVALPFTKGKRASARADRNLQTLLTPYSFRALAALYSLERLPAYADAVWTARGAGDAGPWEVAAQRLLVEVMRRARDAGEAVSTADAVAAWRAARDLATLRGNAAPTVFDLLDAVQSGYVKGDRRVASPTIERLARAVLVGTAHGRLGDGAGVLPIVADFEAQVKAHRLDTSGEVKAVRLDLHKQRTHREKSAFLHRCAWIDLPLFDALPDAGWRHEGAHYRGPDPVRGTDMHLITETWGVRFSDEVFDALVDRAADGATVAQAAAARLRSALAEAREDAAQATSLLLRCAQMMLDEQVARALDTVEAALAADADFVRLVDALGHLVLLHTYADALPTQGDARVRATVEQVYAKAALVLPNVAHLDDIALPPVLDRLQALTRVALTFEAAMLDRGLLVERLRTLVQVDGVRPAVEGAAYGVLYGFGAAREATIVAALRAYLGGTAEHARAAGGFLDGLFQSARGVFLRSPRLLAAVGEALTALDWEVFKVALPDLRRAFTRFIPTEIDHIAERARTLVGLAEPEETDAPVPAALARVAGALDVQARAALEDWL